MSNIECSVAGVQRLPIRWFLVSNRPVSGTVRSGRNSVVRGRMTFLWVAVAASVATLFILLIVQNATSRERKVDYQISRFAAGDPTFRRCMDHLLGPPLVDG